MSTNTASGMREILPAETGDGRARSFVSLLRKYPSWAWWSYLVICALGVPVYYFAVHGNSQRLVYDAYGFSSATVMFVGLRMNRPTKRGPWIAFALGTAMWSMGDISHFIYTLNGATVPIPSISDVLYVLGYPVLGFGMVSVVRSRTPKAQMTATLDGMIVAIAVGALAWVTVLGQYARDDKMSLAARFTEIAYPTLDLMLVAIIVRLVFSTGIRNFSYRLLFASVSLLVVTDTLSTLATVHSWFSFANSTALDVGWLASYALWGAAALHPSMARLAEPCDAREARYPWAAIVMLGIAAMTAPFIIIIRELQGETIDVGVLTVISAVVFVLIVLRLWLVTKNVESTNDLLAEAVTRQTVFASAAEAFVGASDFNAVAHAGVLAAVAIARNGESWSSFIAGGPSGLTVVAVAGASPWHVGELYEQTAEDVHQLDHGGSVTDGAHDIEGACRLLTAPAHFSAPVMVDNDIRGILIVGTVAGELEVLTAPLSLICVEMGLALKGVESTEERLRQRNERRFQSLVQKSTDLVTLIGNDGTIIYQSPCVYEILGRSVEQMIGRQMSTLVHEFDVVAFQDQFDRVREGAYQSTLEIECRMAHSDGSWRVVSSFMTNLLDDPDVGAIVLNSRDVTERRSLERQLQHQAFHDSLTGLANRALFLDRLNQALLPTRHEKSSIGVMFLDVDDFKTINDSLGHEAGDEVLVALAKRLALAVRPGDTLARLGGDEFAVIVDLRADPEVADLIARRLLQAVREPIQIGAECVSIQASIGIAISDSLTAAPDVLVRNADLAMYTAKKNGKDRSEKFQETMYSRAAYRYDLVTELRQALANQELEVYYQPIVTAHDSKVVGVEALVRWNRKGFGMVPAIEFIEAAESTQLIIPLGEWVLAEACAQAQCWRENGIVDDSFFVSVNLSSRQLGESNIVERVSSALRDSRLPAKSLVLEITESFLMLDSEVGLIHLNSLKSLGLRIAIDDYGTGYSSLSRLADFPVDIVKIDKSFVDRLTSRRGGMALVQSVIDVANALGMFCIAEGVEVESQRRALDEMGCDCTQGYLFAKPMPTVEADLMLRVYGIPQSTSNS